MLTKVFDCCLFSGQGDYRSMEEYLTMYVSRFRFEREIRPFMMAYRDWALYVVDTRGMSASHKFENLTALAKLIRSYPARTVAIWSLETWEDFKSLEPEAAYSRNCLFCDSPDWVEKLVKSLKIYQRKLKKYGLRGDNDGKKN